MVGQLMLVGFRYFRLTPSLLPPCLCWFPKRSWQSRLEHSSIPHSCIGWYQIDSHSDPKPQSENKTRNAGSCSTTNYTGQAYCCWKTSLKTKQPSIPQSHSEPQNAFERCSSFSSHKLPFLVWFAPSQHQWCIWWLCARTHRLHN